MQYNEDNRGNTENPITINTVCDIMNDESVGVMIERLSAVNALIMADRDDGRAPLLDVMTSCDEDFQQRQQRRPARVDLPDMH